MRWFQQIVCHSTLMAVKSIAASTRWSEFLIQQDLGETFRKDKPQVCTAYCILVTVSDNFI